MSRELDSPERVRQFIAAMYSRSRTGDLPTEVASLPEHVAPETESEDSIAHRADARPEHLNPESVTPIYGSDHLFASPRSPEFRPTPSPRIAGLRAPQNTPQTKPSTSSPPAQRSADQIASDAVHSFAQAFEEGPNLEGSYWSPKNTAIRAQQQTHKQAPQGPLQYLTGLQSPRRAPAVDESFGRMSFKVADAEGETPKPARPTQSKAVTQTEATGDQLASSKASEVQGSWKDSPLSNESLPGVTDFHKHSFPAADSFVPPHKRRPVPAWSGHNQHNQTLNFASSRASGPEAEVSKNQSASQERLQKHFQEDSSALSPELVTELEGSETKGVSPSENKESSLSANLMTRWLRSGKKDEALPTPEKSSTDAADLPTAQACKPAKSPESKPEASVQKESIATSELKPNRSSGLSTKDVAVSHLQKDVETGKDEEDREHALIFKTWPKLEARDRPAAKIRTILIKSLPPGATPAFIASLIFGGPVERIRLMSESTASVRFLFPEDCKKFYEATSNGLVYSRDPQGKEKVVWVSLGKDVDVVGGLLRQWIEAEYTRCVRAVPVEEAFGKEYLWNMASKKGKHVEGIADGKSPSGARFVIFRFMDLSHAVQFRAMLMREEEWEQCNITFATDPCAVATEPKLSIQAPRLFH